MSESNTAQLAPSHGAAGNAYLSGNFAPMTCEITAFNLETRGCVPDELEGRLLRIGPSPISPVDRALYHWFTGTGLVHGLRLRGSRAEWYRSRFTMSADAAAALGKPPIPGPGKGQTTVNTNVMVIGGRVLAIVEAGELPIELDYNLESVARSDFGGSLEGGFTAHPKRDPVTGEEETGVCRRRRGYGDVSKLFPRRPRLAYKELASRLRGLASWRCRRIVTFDGGGFRHR